MLVHSSDTSHFRSRRGFSLTELLIVIACVGILTATVLVAIKGTQERARLARLYAFSGQVYRTLVSDCAGIWDFDTRQVNTTPDTCRAGQTGQITNGATTVLGINNTQGLNFDGTNDFVRFTAVPALGKEYTLEAWAYPHTLSGLDVMLGRQNATSGGTYPRLARNGTTYAFYVSATLFVQSPANTARLNTWQHVIGTHDGTTARLYLDGIVVASQNVAVVDVAQANWDVGRRYGNNSEAFDGYLDNVRLYNEPVVIK